MRVDGRSTGSWTPHCLISGAPTTLVGRDPDAALGFSPMRSGHERDTMVAMTRSARTEPGQVTRFLLVDDHRDFRRQARALLESEGICVVGEAGDGISAVDEAATLQPDVVILDIGLPDIDGFEVARRLAALETPPLVILISSREAATYGTRVALSRTAGFVRKDDLSAATLGALVPVVGCRPTTGPGGGAT